MEELEVTSTDVAPESSPESSDSAGSEQSAPVQESKPQETFIDHPRFKELIEQNKGYRSELDNNRKALAELQQKYTEFSAPKAQPVQAHPFISDLEKINPQYAEYLRSLEGQVKELSSVRSDIDAFKNQNILKEYESGISRLFSESKVSEPLQSVYRELLDSKAMSGKYGLQDLPTLFKEIHGRLSGVFDNQRKEVTASYVADKTKAANVPNTAPKTPAVSKKPESWKPSGNAEQDVIDIARMAVEQSRAKNIN